MSNFKPFAALIARRVTALFAQGLVYEVEIDADALYAHYLASFPPGSDPMYRTKTEHDCSCCRSFIRQVGHLVAIKDGKLETIWDVHAHGPYAVVAAAMAAKVREAVQIRGVFVTKMSGYGKEHNVEVREGFRPIDRNHFYCMIPPEKRTQDVGTVRGQYAAAYQVLSRGLAEIKLAALTRMLHLMQEGNVYRLADFERSIRGFQTLQREANEATSPYFVWSRVNHAAAGFKNTVAGTFAIDLSEGMPEAQAIARFAQKVSPQNYQMPTAPITSAMATRAIDTLHEKGLDVSVRRRFANPSDIPVSAVLFVDRATRTLLRGGLADVLSKVVVQREPTAATDITGEEFFSSVLPGAEALRLFVSNAQLGNFVTLTAPTEESAPLLFHWDNGIAWVYDGGFADSIAQRVKNAGGNVNALLRVSLAWYNRDDLDIHAYVRNVRGETNHIFFGDKQDVLDVDMHVSAPFSERPVENLAWTKLVDGNYTIQVNNFNQRNAKLGGFEIEYAHNGQTQLWAYAGELAQGGTQPVATLTVANGQVIHIELDAKMQRRQENSPLRPTEKWGVTTEQFVPVTTVMLSPNHWGETPHGAKHYLFMLDNCRCPDSVRGFFNEYLRSDLNEHRKTMDALASQLLCAPTSDQMSGLGFSSTRRDRVIIEVTRNNNKRTYNVQF